MSRVARKPVDLPKGVDITNSSGVIKVKGPKGELSLQLNLGVDIKVADGKAQVSVKTPEQALVMASIVGASGRGRRLM